MFLVMRPRFWIALLLAVSPLVSSRAHAQSGVVAWPLEQVITAAVSRHPLVEAAQARLDAARGERMTAGASPNPVGTVWMETAPFPGQQFGDPLNREISTYVTWPLEPFFQRSARVQRADEDIKAAQASLTLARRQVVSDAARAFYHVALAQALADEAEENKDRLDQLAAYNRARVDEGVTAEGDLLRIQVEVDRAATEVAFTDVELSRARAELVPYVREAAFDSGASPTLRVDVPDIKAPASVPPVNAMLALARERRPELVVGRAQVMAAAAAINVERTLTIRQVGAIVGSKRVEGENSIIAGMTIAVPLFNRNRGGVARAEGERLAAQRELAWTERTIAANVQSAYESVARLTGKLGDLQQSFLARAEDVQRFTLGAYQEGGATLLQVLDATRLLADARLTYARTLFAQRQSLFELALATGAEPTDALDLLHAWSNGTPTPVARVGGGR